MEISKISKIWYPKPNAQQPGKPKEEVNPVDFKKRISLASYPAITGEKYCFILQHDRLSEARKQGVDLVSTNMAASPRLRTKV